MIHVMENLKNTILNNSKGDIMKRKVSVTKIFFLIILLFCSMVLFSCTQEKQSKYAEKVTVRFGWIVDAHQAGFWVAKEKGFYREEGLDVNLQPGGIDVTPIQLVVSGDATFGQVGGIEQVISARSEGIPIKIIAALHQISPHALVSLEKTKIREPKDIEGKTVAIAYGDAAEYLYRTLVNKYHLDRTKIREVPFKFNLTPLIRGDVDAVTGFRTDQTVTLRSLGITPSTLNYDQYGIRSYGYSIIATDKTIEENPALVERFLRATLKGWDYALNNPEEASDIVVKYGVGLERKVELEKLEAVKNIMVTKETKERGLGYIDPLVIESAQNILLENRVLKAPVSIENLYTNEFLNKIYMTKFR